MPVVDYKLLVTPLITFKKKGSKASGILKFIFEFDEQYFVAIEGRTLKSAKRKKEHWYLVKWYYNDIDGLRNRLSGEFEEVLKKGEK